VKNFKIDVKDFLQRERKLLEYLRNRACSPEIMLAANQSLYNFGKFGYMFEASWIVKHYGRDIQITVAGQVQTDSAGDFSLLTYTLCVCQDNVLLRKFHYDHEANYLRDKPFFHLHYGGKPLPSQAHYDGMEELAPWFSEPRLFSTPMSLALILEQVFLEFPKIDTEKIQKDKNWKGHVLKSQKEILAPYFELCCKKISENECLYSECYIRA
jgi:hypothetical protein